MLPREDVDVKTVAARDVIEGTWLMVVHSWETEPSSIRPAYVVHADDANITLSVMGEVNHLIIPRNIRAAAYPWLYRVTKEEVLRRIDGHSKHIEKTLEDALRTEAFCKEELSRLESFKASFSSRTNLSN